MPVFKKTPEESREALYAEPTGRITSLHQGASLFLPGRKIDANAVEVRRLREICSFLRAELKKPPNRTQESLLRRAAWLILSCELMERDIAAGHVATLAESQLYLESVRQIAILFRFIGFKTASKEQVGKGQKPIEVADHAAAVLAAHDDA